MIFILIKAGSFFKLFQVLIISGVKFILAAPLSFTLGFNFVQTILFTTLGGIIGIFFFFYLSEGILRLYRKILPFIKSFFSRKKWSLNLKNIPVKAVIKNKKSFSKKNKFIVLTRRKYGLFGIALLTPVLLSIPLGTFLANKYYKNKKKVLLSLTLSVICWSVIFSTIYILF
jgi:hypothetical protein